MISKRRIVGIKQEATQGAGATLAAADYIIADVEYPDYQFERLERDYHRASYDPLAFVVGKKTVKIKIKTELKGSGVAGASYVPLGAAIQACAFTETIVAVTSVTHLPLTIPVTGFIGPGKSVVIEVFLGGTAIGTKHIIKGCVGNGKISSEINKLPMIEFDFSGQYVATTTADLPSTTYLAQLPVVWQNSTILVHGYAANVKKWEIDFGNDIQLDEDPTTGKDGIGGWFIAGRKPTASVEILSVGLATFNPIALMASGAVASASLTVGAVAGNIITLTMPKTQLADVKYGDINNQITNPIPLIPSQNTGDDWFSMVIT